MVRNARFEAIEGLISQTFETIEGLIRKTNELYEIENRQKVMELIANHPLAKQELAKEMEDLQRLKNADKLEPELLEWLRTTSCGKSIIDLSKNADFETAG